MIRDHRIPKRESGQTTEQAFFKAEGERIDEGSGLLHLADDSFEGREPSTDRARDIRSAIHVHPTPNYTISDVEEDRIAAMEKKFLRKLVRDSYANLQRRRNEIKDVGRITDSLTGDYGLSAIEPEGVFGNIFPNTELNRKYH